MIDSYSIVYRKWLCKFSVCVCGCVCVCTVGDIFKASVLKNQYYLCTLGNWGLMTVTLLGSLFCRVRIFEGPQTSQRKVHRFNGFNIYTLEWKHAWINHLLCLRTFWLWFGPHLCQNHSCTACGYTSAPSLVQFTGIHWPGECVC